MTALLDKTLRGQITSLARSRTLGSALVEELGKQLAASWAEEYERPRYPDQAAQRLIAETLASHRLAAGDLHWQQGKSLAADGVIHVQLKLRTPVSFTLADVRAVIDMADTAFAIHQHGWSVEAAAGMDLTEKVKFRDDQGARLLLDTLSVHPAYHGHGWLGARNYAAQEGEYEVQRVDGALIFDAQRADWTLHDLLLFLDSTPGRHLADRVFAGEPDGFCTAYHRVMRTELAESGYDSLNDILADLRAETVTS